MNAIELKLNDIYRGKATMIKDNRYFSTQQYVEPFVDRVDKMCQGNFIVKAQPANQISLTPQGDINMEDIVFNRVNIEAVLPNEFGIDGHQQVIGMVYGLDTRRPVVKQYLGAIRSACLNLCVFNYNALNVQEVLPETAINYEFIDNLKLIDDISVKLKEFQATVFDQEDCTEFLGKWIDSCINLKISNDFGSIKISESTPIEAYKNIFYNTKSPYYTNKGTTSKFDVYNAFTDIICNGKSADMINKFEKVYLVSKILENM